MNDMGGERRQVQWLVILGAALSAVQVAQHNMLPLRHKTSGICVQHIL